MLNQNPKPYFNQVAMIESQYESKRRNLTNSNNASLLQNKSPMRERENTNSINTPSRQQLQNGNKVSLSPLRSRRNQQSTTSIRATAISRKKSVQNYCQNHGNKVAKFMIDKDNQSFYFCDRCAIPLISNGFKLVKINEEQSRQAQNPRLQQINQFLKLLEVMDSNLNKKKQGINQVLTKGESQLSAEVQKIQQFYAQFYEIIDEHKRRVVEQIKGQYQKSSKSSTISKERVEEAIKDSINMRQDILSSMNSVILEVMDHEFRSVMNQYYENLEGFREICNSKHQQNIKVRTLSFRDAQTSCQNIIDGLVIQWNDEQGQVDDNSQGTELKINNMQYQMRPKRQQQESERQNPIECLETQERKSKTKQLNGLFCSFDQ